MSYTTLYLEEFEGEVSKKIKSCELKMDEVKKYYWYDKHGIMFALNKCNGG